MSINTIKQQSEYPDFNSDPISEDDEMLSDDYPEADEFGGEEMAQAPDVTRAQILELFQKVQKGEVAPQNGAKPKEILAILSQALRYEAAHNDTASAEAYASIAESLGLDGESETSEENSPWGMAPREIKNKVLIFDGKETDGEVELKASGEKEKASIENANTITLSPAKEGDTVTLSERGTKIVVKMGKTEIEVPRDAKLYILSDRVQGDLDNEDGNIVTGTKSGKVYFPKDRLDAAAQALKESLGKIGYYQQRVDEVPYEREWSGGRTGAAILTGGLSELAQGAHASTELQYMSPTSSNPNATYVIGYAIGDVNSAGTLESNAAREFRGVESALTHFHKALGTNKKEVWESLYDCISQIGSQTENPGSVNNIGRFLANVLISELGEDKTKELMKGSPEFQTAMKMISGLINASPEENTKMSEVSYQKGGLQWTHQTFINWIDKYSGEGLPSTKKDDAKE